MPAGKSKTWTYGDPSPKSWGDLAKILKASTAKTKKAVKKDAKDG